MSKRLPIEDDSNSSTKESLTQPCVLESKDSMVQTEQISKACIVDKRVLS